MGRHLVFLLWSDEGPLNYLYQASVRIGIVEDASTVPHSLYINSTMLDDPVGEIDLSFWFWMSVWVRRITRNWKTISHCLRALCFIEWPENMMVYLPQRCIFKMSRLHGEESRPSSTCTHVRVKANPSLDPSGHFCSYPCLSLRWCSQSCLEIMSHGEPLNQQGRDCELVSGSWRHTYLPMRCYENQADVAWGAGTCIGDKSKLTTCILVKYNQNISK